MVGQELVILDMEGKKILGLNETGAAVWEMVNGSFTVEKISGRLAEEFEVGHKQAQEDVYRFLEDLESRGLVELECTNSTSGISGGQC